MLMWDQRKSTTLMWSQPHVGKESKLMDKTQMEVEMEKKKKKSFRSITRQNMEEINREQQLKYLVIVAIVSIILNI